MNNSFQRLINDIVCLMQMDAENVVENCNVSSVPGMHALTVFVLACFVGYYVVWKVTPVLHAPLMSVTNAISSVIIVGAILATAQHFYDCSRIFGFIAIALASINIFGGFAITHRMLNMFQKNR